VEDANPPLRLLKAPVRCRQGCKQTRESEWSVVREQKTNQYQTNEQGQDPAIHSERSNGRPSANDEEEGPGRRPTQNEKVAGIGDGRPAQPEEYGSPSSRLKRDDTTRKGNGSDDLREKEISHA